MGRIVGIESAPARRRLDGAIGRDEHQNRIADRVAVADPGQCPVRAAELQHGPRASITPATPVLVLRQNDQAALAIDEFVRDLNATAATAFTVGGADGTLPWIGDGHPVCDPVLMLVPAYRAIEAAARRRGFDPDSPPYLSKMTRTL